MRRGIGVLIFSALIVSNAARADDTNLVGALVGLEVSTTSADNYLQYHGRMFVKNDGGTVDEYRWGGVSCGSRLLTEDQVAMLQRALSAKKMTIGTITQDGQGDAKCVVGFSLAEKKNVALLP